MNNMHKYSRKRFEQICFIINKVMIKTTNYIKCQNNHKKFEIGDLGVRSVQNTHKKKTI
jgi:hypothetical protein